MIGMMPARPIDLERINKLREALDRIARFEEAFAAVTDKHKGYEAGAAMSEVISRYARRTLDEDSLDALP